MSDHWTGTWTATPASADGVSLDNATIRMFPRISVGGQQVRVRLSNAAGTGDLIVAATSLARRATGARIRPVSDLPVTFNGAPQVKIPAGAFVVSDPIAMSVKPLEDLAVSIHIPSIVPASFGVTGRYDGHRLHPGNIGHDRMGDVIDLSLFDRPGAGFSRIYRARSRRLVGPRA